MLKGSLVALVTPMEESGVLDFSSLELLVERQLQAGTSGLVVAGSTGEAAALSSEEFIELVACVVDVVKHRVPVIVGTGTNVTATSIERACLAQSLGADGLLVVTPYYNKPTQAGLYAHYIAVAQAVDIPIYLYNVPVRTGCDLLPQTVEKLAQTQCNILGLKEALATTKRHKQLLSLDLPDDFSLLSGDDLTAPEFITLGAHGVISVMANIAPEKMVELVMFAQDRELEKMQYLQSKMFSLNELLFCQTNPIPVKWALCAMGLLKLGIRSPLLTLENRYQADLIAALHSLEIISLKEYS